jgi:gluconokinase
MGVSGSGKSTVGAAVAARVAARFVDADDLHPASNVAKMAAGMPLTDEDRHPWLVVVGDEIARWASDGGEVVTACSALKRSYRDLLRAQAGDLFFAHLHGPAELLAQRMGGRTDHFMPSSLLQSQLATLEPLQPDEPGVTVDIAASPAAVVDAILVAWQGHAPGGSLTLM